MVPRFQIPIKRFTASKQTFDLARALIARSVYSAIHKLNKELLSRKEGFLVC